MKIEKLSESNSALYEKFVLDQENSFLYHSNGYRRLLREFLNAQDIYLLALDEQSNIVGVLPSFISTNGHYGTVLNSLPFYGSYGAVLSADMKARKKLLSAFEEFALNNNCISSTIITSPFENDLALYEKDFTYHLRDYRIGQLTPLDMHEELYHLIEPTARRNIKKATRSGVSVSWENGQEDIDYLATTHIENMQLIGGRTKPKSFFKLIDKYFNYGVDYRIYTARIGIKPVSSLLLFYYKNCVEYFTPVIGNSYRSLQPLSLILYQAMRDAAEEGYRWWNWGGTWPSQVGVYKFKKKWGARDYLYHYFIRIGNSAIKTIPSEKLLDEYPYFYVVPFGWLLENGGGV